MIEQQVRLEDASEEYKAFVDKFKPKLTTDDCYTPDLIAETVDNWVSNRYGIDRSKFLKPFYPGGDYEHADYPSDCLVCDNPPFSIISKIVRFYTERGIRFFLYAPTLTLMGIGSGDKKLCRMFVNETVTYENGANVNTSFVMNLETGIYAMTQPELAILIEKANKENTKIGKVHNPKYVYPDEVLSGGVMNYIASHHVDYVVRTDECCFIRSIDEQKKTGKTIFGGGVLLSKRAAAERAAAERAAAERAAAIRWRLSDREKQIVEKLSANQ